MTPRDYRVFAAGWMAGLATAFLLWLIVDKASAQTRADVLNEIKRQNIPHPSIVLAQARLESGNMKSEFYRNTNNLFGMKDGARYARYKTWRDSVRDYKRRISRRYDGGCYYEFLKRIGYATDPKYIDKLRDMAG